jgi:hypothetical protein
LALPPLCAGGQSFRQKVQWTIEEIISSEEDLPVTSLNAILQSLNANCSVFSSMSRVHLTNSQQSKRVKIAGSTVGRVGISSPFSSARVSVSGQLAMSSSFRGYRRSQVVGNLLVELAPDNQRKDLSLPWRKGRHERTHGPQTILLFALGKIPRERTCDTFEQGLPRV